MSDNPLANGLNGRDPRGQFAKGNAGGPGNPVNAKVQKLRQRFIECVTLDDIDAVIMKLLELAKGGDIQAIRELFDRVFGRSPATITANIGGDSKGDDPLMQVLHKHPHLAMKFAALYREAALLEDQDAVGRN